MTKKISRKKKCGEHDRLRVYYYRRQASTFYSMKSGTKKPKKKEHLSANEISNGSLPLGKKQQIKQNQINAGKRERR